jgi:hypothetical protein
MLGIIHILHHICVTLSTAGSFLVFRVLTTLLVFKRFGIIDISIITSEYRSRFRHTQFVGLEGTLEVSTTLNCVGVIVVGVFLFGFTDHVFGTTGLELLVFLLGNLQDSGALVFRSRGRDIVTETTFEEFGTTGLVQDLVFKFNHFKFSRAIIPLV